MEFYHVRKFGAAFALVGNELFNEFEAALAVVAGRSRGPVGTRGLLVVLFEALGMGREIPDRCARKSARGRPILEHFFLLSLFEGFGTLL